MGCWHAFGLGEVSQFTNYHKPETIPDRQFESWHFVLEVNSEEKFQEVDIQRNVHLATRLENKYKHFH